MHHVHTSPAHVLARDRGGPAETGYVYGCEDLPSPGPGFGRSMEGSLEGV